MRLLVSVRSAAEAVAALDGAAHIIAAKEPARGPLGAVEPAVLAAITQLLDAGRRDGSIRADADAGDFLQLTAALWRAASGPRDRSQAMLGLILDGLGTDRRRRP